MIKKLRKSKGFTLVELLIVIIIIGILAGMMMLSSGAATDKAEATKIVADLRNIKAAAIMYYADNNSWPSGDLVLSTPGAEVDKVNKYLDTIPTVGYKLTNTSGTIGAGYVAGPKITAGVQSKLAAMASTAGLYQAAPTSGDVSTGPNYTTGTTVYMIVKK